MTHRAAGSLATRIAALALLPLAFAGCDGGAASSDTTPSTRNDSTAAGTHDETSGGYGGKPKFDPVDKNGPIFEGWETPRLALVVSGQQQGYIEPCGCAGLENQKGGLSRRFTFLKERRDLGWPIVAVDAGGIIRRFGKQSEIKLKKSLQAYVAMDYDAIALGLEDLNLPAVEVFTLLNEVEAGSERFVSANVAFAFDDTFLKKQRIVERAGLKVGITTVLGDSYHDQISNAEILFTPAADALAEIVPQLAAECDLLVLVAHAPQKEAQDLARRFPEFQIVVASDGGDEPPSKPLLIEGTETPLVEVGHKGMHVGVLAIDDPSKRPFRYQKVPLDARFADSPEMREIMSEYQSELENLGRDGLEIAAALHPRGQTSGNAEAGLFVGAQTCKTCHPTAFGIWSKTPHAHATESLLKSDPTRQFDPECLSCHATGWNPQEYIPFESGFVSLDETPLLVGNSCENCHGPGGAHVAAERGGDAKSKETWRSSMRLSKALAEENVCLKCHDLDNSPDFEFPVYWPKVEHRGKR